MASKYLYPVDNDQFAEIREQGHVYVDKTGMHFDISNLKNLSVEDARDKLGNLLSDYERIYGADSGKKLQAPVSEASSTAPASRRASVS